MTAHAIETEALEKTYGLGRKKVRAVDGLSLHVPEGSIYGLLGRNSAGKTTTIRMAVGLARPTAGTIRVFGLDPARDPERVMVLSQVGYVPEDKAQAALTARALLQLNREFYRDTWSDDLARKAIRRLELPLDTTFLKLSLGNKTKSALVSAIAQRSRLLILDEPTTGLDPIALDELLRLLVEDCTLEGRTIFLSSHQLTEIERIADYVGIMDRGRILLEGRLDDIRASFRRMTVTGEALPAGDVRVLTSRRVGHATEMVVQREPEEFAAELGRGGATVVASTPLSLNEIFIELCRNAEAKDDRIRPADFV